VSAVQAYLAKPYTRVLVPDSEEGGYIAEVLELPGCLSQGETPDEAYANLEEAMAGYIAASLDHGKPVPEPVGAKEYSGHFPLRISSELHRAAALRAMHEGISLNQWIGQAIAERLAARNLADEVVARLKDVVAGRRRRRR
jgi:antitoxin HicB